MQRPVFYAIAIIITAYMPIFTLQRVEGRLFKPMAWTVAFALLGALTLLHADRAGAGQPAVSIGREGMAQPVDGLSQDALPYGRAVDHPQPDIHRGAAAMLFAVAMFLGFSGVIGSEFLPHLDEGAIWVRGTLAPSTGPTEGARVANQSTASSLLVSRSDAGAPARWAGPTTAPTPPDFSTPNISSI